MSPPPGTAVAVAVAVAVALADPLWSQALIYPHSPFGQTTSILTDTFDGLLFG